MPEDCGALGAGDGGFRKSSLCGGTSSFGGCGDGDAGINLGAKLGSDNCRECRLGDDGGEMNLVGGDLDTTAESGFASRPFVDLFWLRPASKVAPCVKPSFCGIAFPGLTGGLLTSVLMSIRGLCWGPDLELLLLEFEESALPGRRGGTRDAKGASSSESELESDPEPRVGLKDTLVFDFVGGRGAGTDCVDAPRLCRLRVALLLLLSSSTPSGLWERRGGRGK